MLEYATERAGALIAFEGKELGLGVVNPRTDEVEIARSRFARPSKRRSALRRRTQIFLNPDCGFGTFSNRPMNTLGDRVRQG